MHFSLKIATISTDSRESLNDIAKGDGSEFLKAFDWFIEEIKREPQVDVAVRWSVNCVVLPAETRLPNWVDSGPPNRAWAGNHA
jgi:hypothetical protein